MTSPTFACPDCGKLFKFGNRRTQESRRNWALYLLGRHACRRATLEDRSIRTPRGKSMTLRRYVAFQAMRFSSHAGAAPCEYGHFDCAAWERGPCSDEIRAELGQEGADE